MCTFFLLLAMQTWINHVSLFSLLSHYKPYNIYIHYDLKQFGSLWVTRYSKMLWFTLRELTCSHKSTPTIAIVSVSIMRASTGIKTRSLMWQTNNECISNSNAQRVEGLRRILTVQPSNETISRKSSSSYSYQHINVGHVAKRRPLGVKKCSNEDRRSANGRTNLRKIEKLQLTFLKLLVNKKLSKSVI